MKKHNPKTTLSIDPISSIKDKQESYEIIYADPRDEEIHLKFLQKAQISAHMARWFLDHEYNQLIWSDGIFEIFELDAKKYGASYFNFIQIVHPDDRHLKNQAQEDLQKTLNPIEINYRLLFNDGRIKWINEICNTDFDQDGHPIRSYGTIQDITKYKLTEENFRQKEERFKSLIESIPSGIVICQDNKLAFVNPAGRMLLQGNTQLKLKGINISKIVFQKSKNKFLKKIKSATYGQIEPIFEEKLIRLDETYFDAEITLTKTTFQSSPAVQIIFNDITKRKNTEEALRKSEEKFRMLAVNLSENEIRLKDLIVTKDKFFSIIAHDLRSPFNSIIGFLDLLINQYEDFDDSEKKEFLKVIENNANNTLKLLENLLEWAKAQTGKVLFQPNKQKLLPAIENLVETMNPALNLKRLTLNYSIPENLEIYADTNMLTTILQNLLSNAIKYSNPGEIISINATLNDNMLEVIVSDTGTGISEEVKKKLFRIDEHVSLAGTANEKGSGLGLILCKDFIERHKGTIWVESEQGLGSRFVFRIPQQN